MGVLKIVKLVHVITNVVLFGCYLYPAVVCSLDLTEA